MPPVADLNVDDLTPENYATFINAIRDHVAAREAGTVDVSSITGRSGQRVGMWSMGLQEHTESSAASMFFVRLVDGDGRHLLDWYMQDTNLYGWGFTRPGQTTFYHLGIPNGSTPAMNAASPPADHARPHRARRWGFSA
ncbi:ribosome-inactivating family protein [Embleya sp. NPDC055664]